MIVGIREVRRDLPEVIRGVEGIIVDPLGAVHVLTYVR